MVSEIRPKALLAAFPNIEEYLRRWLWADREKWAGCLVSTTTTLGVRTMGRVERENRVNQALGGPKVTVTELFQELAARDKAQLVSTLQRRLEQGRGDMEHTLLRNSGVSFHPRMIDDR